MCGEGADLSMAEANFTEEPKLMGVSTSRSRLLKLCARGPEADAAGPELGAYACSADARMEEEDFWRNGHTAHNIFALGWAGRDAMKDLGSCKEEDAIIHSPDVLPPSQLKMSNPPSPNPNDKASATTPSLKGVGLGEEVGDEEFTEEEQERLALKKRKEEEAALAAEVEAELLNEDIGAIDLDDLDLDADLERELNGEGRMTRTWKEMSTSTLTI